ncbi:MAG: hypothetical protein RUMPE_01173 [Eubacteriales bacterium SKADARSKE-1]|nr:hypothetical protein [Eubacteriales bacterium SKADARSKE-1]
MRTKNSIINSLSALFSYAILFLGPFFVSPFLETVLGKEVLGIQKTFLDTTALLSIVELGISYGIIYKLYEPIAQNNTSKIALLLKFYKSAFKIVSIIVLFLGVSTAFIIPSIIVDKHTTQNFSNVVLSSIFMLYVLDTLLTYLFGHKRAMLIADQKNYIVTACRTSCQLFMYIIQIFVICFFKSFFLYVIVKVVFTFLESLLVDIQYKKRYKSINLKTKDKLDKVERKDLFKNLNALFYHKLGYQSLISGSTLIMANKLGKVVTGIYYPYTLITNGLVSATTQVFNAILSSFGNFLVKSTEEETFNIYQKIYFLNYLIFSFFSVSVFCLIIPFISIWMGTDFVFPFRTILLITVNFYFLGMRQSITMAKSSVGLYRPDRYLAVLEAVFNLFLSWKFAQSLGLDGILIANLISTLAIPFWTQPYLVYKNVFKRPVISYYKKYALYFVITTASTALTYYICSVFKLEPSFFTIFVYALICLIVPNIINILLFYRTNEFKYLLEISKGIILKLKKGK